MVFGDSRIYIFFFVRSVMSYVRYKRLALDALYTLELGSLLSRDYGHTYFFFFGNSLMAILVNRLVETGVPGFVLGLSGLSFESWIYSYRGAFVSVLRNCKLIIIAPGYWEP